MAGYLDAYGTTGLKRERLIKWLSFSLAAAAIVALTGYFTFRDYREAGRVKEFLEHLRAGDYKPAYALWGCTEAHPCRDYAFDKFLEDWGPGSRHANASGAHLEKTRTCEGGVISYVSFPGQEDEHLYVDSKTLQLGFVPWTLREIPPTLVNRIRLMLWEISRDCEPLIQR
ncbi:MAG: hypothetical protein HYZ57_21365 [Acidobacteria bacterium]|nr:hypothetical protein [Acidobacteriota bacterium]MBI3282377.1 hypothetical protein [Acidobacteriota bacterium]